MQRGGATVIFLVDIEALGFEEVEHQCLVALSGGVHDGEPVFVD